MPINQDRITNNVWLTRASAQGIFNFAQELAFQRGLLVSPVGTEWAFGSIVQGIQTLTFDDWETTVGGNPPGAVNHPMVVHLIADDIYFDLTMTNWGSQGAAARLAIHAAAPLSRLPRSKCQ